MLFTSTLSFVGTKARMLRAAKTKYSNCLSESGAMKTGWQKDGETWYYLSESGAMKTGWVQIGADWFYLNSNGSMAADTYIGKWYVP